MEDAAAAARAGAAAAGRLVMETLRKTRDGFGSLRGSPREVRAWQCIRCLHRHRRSATHAAGAARSALLPVPQHARPLLRLGG